MKFVNRSSVQFSPAHVLQTTSQFKSQYIPYNYQPILAACSHVGRVQCIVATSVVETVRKDGAMLGHLVLGGLGVLLVLGREPGRRRAVANGGVESWGLRFAGSIDRSDVTTEH